MPNRTSAPVIEDPGSSVMMERFFSLSLDMLGVGSEAGYFTRVSPACERILGWTPDQLMGKPYISFVHPDDVERTLKEIARLSEPGKGASVGFSNRCRAQTGEYRSMEWQAAAEDGLVYFVARDVTRRNQHEEAMDGATSESEGVNDALASGRGSASLLASIIDASVDAIIGKDLAGTITSWNLGAERMYGYKADEVIGQHISLLFPPDCLDELDDALTRIANGGLVEQHDTKRVCKDGTVLDISVTIAPIHDSKGEITGASAVGRNITQRLRLERERRNLDTRLNQSERLESMGRLAGGIAHDFNNLLAVILNYSTFVSEELEDQEAAKADLEQIRIAAERASALTRQLLAFARREVLQPRVLNLNQVVGDLEELLRRTISEQIVLEMGPSDGLWNVEADPGQLEQVLVNLVVNARDAMPDGGVITIDTENVEVDEGYSVLHPLLNPGKYVCLRVSDTGAGMDQSVLEHVFEPFFTTKAQGEGTGLGLPMVFGIIRQAGGDIQLYSEIGIGTTCHVLLPVTEHAPPEDGPAERAPVLRGVETVLVVEDEDALREVTRRILARNGYEVLTSSDGPEALAIAESHSGTIHLLLTDVIMPKMVGKEVATKVQEIRAGLPVLFMSGYAQPVLGSTLGEEYALLEKPFSEKVLLAKVRSVLDAAR